MALTDSLISYWKCDEASGNLLDAHGTNELTDTNTVGSTTGIISNARSHSRASREYFTIASNSYLVTGDIDFTFNIWVNLASKPVDAYGYMVPVAKWAGGTKEYFLNYNTGVDRFVARFTPDGSTETAVTANNFGSPSLSTWYMVTFWHDATNNQVGIAVNAGTPDTASYSSGVYSGTAAFQVGWPADGTDFTAQGAWNGYLDELGFWKRVLTSGERTSLYNGGAGLAYPFAAIAPISDYYRRLCAA